MNREERTWILLLIVLCTTFLMIPHLLRFRIYDTLIGYDVYAHIRSSDLLKSHQKVREDILFSGGRPYPLSTIDIMLSYLPYRLFFMRFLPLIFGVFSVILFYAILRKSRVPCKQRLIATGVLITSPVFLYTFLIFNVHAFIIFFSLLGLNFLLNDSYLPAILVFALVPLVELHLFILPIIILLIYYQKFRSNRPLPTLLVLSILLVVSYAMLTKRGLPSLSGFPAGFIADLGADLGFGIFQLASIVLGIVLSWRHKKDYIIFYITIGFGFILSFFNKDYLVYLIWILVYFGGLFITTLANIKWKLPLLKHYTIFLILLGLLFSSVSFLDKVYKLPPTTAETQGLEWLRGNSQEGEVVLSHYRFGSLIQAVAKRPVVTDKIYYATSLEKLRIMDSNELFYTRDLEDAHTILKKYNVTFLWINEAMKQGLVWDREEQGILFLLHNTDDFKKIYDYQGVEIWKVV